MPLALRTFLDQLGPRLLRIPDEVDPVHQVGILCSEASGPVLFENLRGFPGWSLCDILFKDREAQAIALGCNPREVVPLLAERMYGRGPNKAAVVESGPVQEVALLGEAADLTRLPIPIHSNGDAGRYLGSGITITKDPETGVRNAAIIRSCIRGPRQFGFSMAARHNWNHYLKYEASGVPMPMAYAIGLHPVYESLANWSGPHPNFDELELAAGVLGETVEMVRCQTIDLEVPAHAEVVIEGLVPPHQRESEGPFGEQTNYLSGAAKPAPVFNVTAITHRRKPIFRHMQATLFTDHQILTGVPMEAAYYRRLRETQGFTEIHDVYVPAWGADYIMIIQMTGRWEGQARDVLLSALSGPNLHPKIVIAVDADVDIYNPADVFWALSTRVNPEIDVIMIPHQRAHSLDISAPPFIPPGTEGAGHSRLRLGGKLAIDATKPPLWRARDRDHFERLKPMGAGDPALDALLARVRQPRPSVTKE